MHERRSWLGWRRFARKSAYARHFCGGGGASEPPPPSPLMEAHLGKVGRGEGGKGKYWGEGGGDFEGGFFHFRVFLPFAFFFRERRSLLIGSVSWRREVRSAKCVGSEGEGEVEKRKPKREDRGKRTRGGGGKKEVSGGGSGRAEGRRKPRRGLSHSTASAPSLHSLVFSSKSGYAGPPWST